ncbi:lipase family protein [Nocardia sp. NPDC006630]|uniref:lipase family protein n=1 Tax=Nocardia sp. NPDC006630 TaxID=3157181 RepID=UPI0033BF88CA
MSVNADFADETAVPEPIVFDRPRVAVLPESDPFYVPPKGWERLAPGTILHRRSVTISAFGRIRQSLTAWQLLYRTTDLNGAADTTVVTILIPPASGTELRPRILSFQCATDAVASRCFPSYSLQQGAKVNGAVPPFELFLIGAALERGWIVCAADHEGMLGAFGAPREPGYRSLDGIRAAINFAPLALAGDTPAGLFGYSGGGMATAWTAEMADAYAPELNIVGAAAGSPVGDPASTFLRLNATAFAGLPSLVIAGLRRVSPELDAVITEFGTPEGHRRLRMLESQATVGAVLRSVRTDWDDFLTEPLADVLARPAIVELFRTLQLGGNAPSMPMLVVQSVHDQLIAVGDVDGAVQRYTAGGAHVTYLRDKLSEHLTLAVFAAPLMFDWLGDRFEGHPVPEAGTRTVWTVLSSRRSCLELARFIHLTTRMLLGRTIRVRRSNTAS